MALKLQLGILTGSEEQEAQPDGDRRRRGSPGGRSATWVCASPLTNFAMPTAVSVWTWAWTSASSLKRWDTSPWSRPRSIRRSPSSALAASPNYLAPPGRSNNPMQNAERNPLLHAGLNFQKQFAPTRMRANLACYKTAAHEKCPSNIIRGMSDIHLAIESRNAYPAHGSTPWAGFLSRS